MGIDTNNFYTGTSGLLLPVPNKQFYPEAFKDRSRLCYYASLMNSLEINSSFYKTPQGSTVKKWSADVPEDFRFTFKLFKGITHQTNLTFHTEELSRFMEVISNVGEKKGCLLVQFPPSIRVGHLPQLSNVMSALRDNNPGGSWNIAFEFRHPSLYVEEVYERLEEFGHSLVLHDKGIAASPLNTNSSAFVYLRFHGPEGNYRGSYSTEILYEYATYIREWLDEGKQVYVYFNNTMGNLHENLKVLSRFVRSAQDG